jgi:hypothetical protein
MAARNRGIERRPVRYVSSPAATSGIRTVDMGSRAAPAIPPTKKSRFHRKKNASRR